MKVIMMKHPSEEDWFGVKLRALITVGKEPIRSPSIEWKHMILDARHSPIRYLQFSFLLTEVPYWVACELRTHVHDMPYVAGFGVYIKSSRNDRQADFDRNAARQDAPVNMILDINAEQMQILANKRLCQQASKEARDAVADMCAQVEAACPEFVGLLVPMCAYRGGVCHEMNSCAKMKG